MSNSIELKKISFEYTYLLSVSIGLFGLLYAAFPDFSSLGIIFPFSAIVYGYVKREIKFNWGSYQTLFVSFYALYLLSYWWTTDPEIGIKQLEYKMSFFVFPLLFAFEMKRPLKLAPIIWLWMLGLIIATSFGIMNACECEIPDLPHRCWVTTRISTVHHPTYFTGYNTLLLLMIGYAWYKKIRGFKLWWIVPLFVVDLMLHLMYLSMAGILFLGLSIFVLTCYLIYVRWGKKVAIISSAFVMLIGLFTLNNIPYFASDWKGTVEDSMNFIKAPEAYIDGLKKPLDGNDQRLVLWTVAAIELGENPMGSGIGSVDKSMHDGLVELNQSELNEKGMNPHNQYLQVGLELGWWGLAFFLFILIYMLRSAWRNRDLFTMFLVSNLIFNSMFESMLQRQSGIVFYMFFISVFIVYNQHEKKRIKEEYN